MLASVSLRMGPVLRQHFDAEDIWQETLIQAWRARGQFRSDGPVALRAWLLAIAENRIRNAIDGIRTQRRGGGKSPRRLRGTSSATNSAAGSSSPEPESWRTPSRDASDRERAHAMLAALDALSPELRDVVRLRLFDATSTEETARVLGIGVSATKHRLRRGLESYVRILRLRLGDTALPVSWNP